MTEIHLRPYSRLYPCTSFTPAIFAMAYASFVTSSGPVKRDSSVIGYIALRG